MRPMSLEETKSKLSNGNATALNIKKRRGPVLKEKRDPEIIAVKNKPIVTTSSQLIPENRGKCLYQSRKCENERAMKRNGKPHNLCDVHRSRQNQHQRKFDAKKFARKRLRHNELDDDVKVDKDELQPRRNGESISKDHGVMADQVAETTTSTATTSMVAVAAKRGKYSSMYTTGSASMSAPLTRLLPIQSPRGSILPTWRGIIHRSMTPTVVQDEAYPRGHVSYSDCRSRAECQQSSHWMNLQQQVLQSLPGNSHFKFAAANILVEPQPCTSAALSSLTSCKNENSAAGMSRGAISTPQLLPSLLAPRVAVVPPSSYQQVDGIMISPTQRSASMAETSTASVSLSTAKSVGKVLPPLMSFGRLKSPTSPWLSLSRQNN